MPAFSVGKISAVVERDELSCVAVALDGTEAPLDFLQVLSIQDAKGPSPGKAVCRVTHAAGMDSADQISLPSAQDAYFGPKQFKGWARVKFTCDGSTIFIGNLTNRIEKGEKNYIQLTFKSDLALLGKIPVRGCLVRDPYTGDVRFVPGYTPIMNPDGFNNCTKAVVNGIDGQVWVFTPMAFANAAGAWTDGVGDDSAAGTAVPWTSERALVYWAVYVAFNPGPAYPEFVKLDQTKLLFEPPSFADALMKQKLPEVGFKGMRVLGAVQRTLDAVGHFDLGILYADDLSILQFRPKTNEANGVHVSGLDIPIQLSGAVEDIKAIFDFELETDYSDLATGVLIEGDTVKIESEWSYDPAAEDASTLRKAWTADEQTNFAAIINGNGVWAKGPATPADLNTPGNWVVMDGGGGRPAITFHSVEALKLARQCFPKVWRAYSLQADQSTVGGATALARLAGVANKFGAVTPLSINRAIDDVQLQPFFESDAASQNTRGRLRWPARVQVKPASGQWHDAAYNNGLRVENDGLLYFDGLTDDQAGDDNIYNLSLAAEPANVTARALRVNAYIAHDTRIKHALDVFWDTSADPNKIKDEIAPSVSNKASRLGFQHYVLAPDAFREEHQVSSRPIGSGVKADTILHTDDLQIAGAASRKLRAFATVKKKQIWWLPGIRLEFPAGQMIGKIVFKGAGENGSYDIDRPLDSVVWDFEHQRTGLVPDV